MKKSKWKLHLLALGIFFSIVCQIVSGNAYAENSAVKASPAVAGRQYGNIWIKWVPNPEEPSLTVTITMGAALIEELHFTPDTLQQTLNYSNPPQSATGTFIVEFDASGKGGKLYCKELKWESMSSEGEVSSFIGAWQTAK